MSPSGVRAPATGRRRPSTFRSRPGDALATRDGRFEVQIGPQAFLRAADQTQLRVKSQEPDFLQIEVTQGTTVLDLRHLPPGHVVEIDTPQGAMTAESRRLLPRRRRRRLHPPDRAPRRRGVADPARRAADPGRDRRIGHRQRRCRRPAQPRRRRRPSMTGIAGTTRAPIAVLAAPRSYAVSTDIYGAADLDRYGGWRYVPTYGRVWVPSSVPVGWAPYTNGRWLWDPVYGYSWVDYAPWGWAPFHYGRWVYSGYWAWAPGPVVFGPVYAPALVSFFTPGDVGQHRLWRSRSSAGRRSAGASRWFRGGAASASSARPAGTAGAGRGSSTTSSSTTATR